MPKASVCAPLPLESPRYRQANYGAWYIPVGKWKDGRGEGGKGGKSGDSGEVAGLLEKMDKEIVKLSSSKMFYQYVKSQGWRVPHYLRRMEHADLAGADA